MPARKNTDLEKLKVVALRKMAIDAGIAGYNKMRKAELITALRKSSVGRMRRSDLATIPHERRRSPRSVSRMEPEFNMDGDDDAGMCEMCSIILAVLHPELAENDALRQVLASLQKRRKH
ncbi:hypothetical protein [Medusavirus stheno T3]|uniref:Rho termination factor-like N-terminal domain-containing protein n=1 Tax=Medusavirus stheno T3 TaxID=3069717 RepID=A0A7S7YEA8_9VIRU|nr:hypothetical protein QKU73_gp005 [Acanthamoeba castellanii medusavirus]QPB44186.1 hypothetical protein [Medusavirus stheno T3]